MKICSPQLGVSPISSLGGEIYDYQTLKGFTEKGIDVFVYLPKNRVFDKKLKHFHVSYAPITHIIPPWLYSIICLPYLFKTYKTEKFDILRIHSARFLGIAGLIFHYFHPEVPILTSEVTPEHGKIFHYIERKIYDKSSAIIVQSNYMKVMLVDKFNLPSKKIFITYGGELEQNKISKPTNNILRNIQRRDFVLLYMGVLEPRKNPRFLLDVIYETLKEIPNAKLVYVGSGVEKNSLIRLAIQKKIKSNVIFVDKAYGAEKSAWFNRMDVFVLASKSEGFGLVVTEAMSYAKTAIVSNIAPFKEIINNGVDGFTLPVSASVWKKTIIELAKDERFREKIGKNAKEKIKKQFNWEKTYALNKKVVNLIAS